MKKSLFLTLLVGLVFVEQNCSAAVSHTENTRPNLPENITLKIEDATYSLSAEEITKWMSESSHLDFNSSYRSEIENYNFCNQAELLVCQMTVTWKNKFKIQKVSTFGINKDSVKQFVQDLARTFDKDPENAKLQIENGKASVFSLSKNGIKISQDEAVEKVYSYFSEPTFSDQIELPFTETRPEVSTDSIDNLGITTLIGEGTSNFAGSPKNRIHNLTIGAQRFNGVLIKPGENFSFLKTLGPVDESTGYLPELVIIGNETKPDFGGGMCQVSTTAFRAAIYSGLKITARRNHAYPVSYYNPQGMDATVFIPSPDLKFTNNTPNYILIQTKIEGTKLIFDFYGTDDGRKINVIGPKITDRQPDGSMKATFTQQVTDKEGNLIIDDIFNSRYDSPYRHPHPGQAPLAEKPANWSKEEWKQYKKDNNL